MSMSSFNMKLQLFGGAETAATNNANSFLSRLYCMMPLKITLAREVFSTQKTLKLWVCNLLMNIKLLFGTANNRISRSPEGVLTYP